MDKSNNEEFGTSGLMKSVVATARQSVHFHDSLDQYLMVKMEAMDENDIDYHTPILKRKDGIAMADKSYGPHSRRCTEAAAWLKTMIQEATCVSELRTDWRVANILPFLLEHHLCFAGWHHGIRHLNKSLPCDWTPHESAQGMMQLYHSDPEQKLRIETMTEEEYEKCEVLHHAPNANGSVGKYMLPENEVRRAVAKAALTMARPMKHKADLPDSLEGNTVGDSKIESPSPKRVRKKSKATCTHAPAKAKPPRMVPGNNSQVNEARLPQNKVAGPQGDDVRWAETDDSGAESET
ncbi:uncharacterized protein EI90DRAFT_3129359 [Cantharellus anzutake]|uniref:uncharacterized protein n=1 Tax=Cantharellus anzutake TaxID=1750568 RepID=UPI0019063608|nr:uncharacterized protein EI90DRAFT_3129359 [Cantharellus anzutake]KAF8324838.1 hypothetical protein EI90DRAFT_3129359 [Cantharellus anzutake]